MHNENNEKKNLKITRYNFIKIILVPECVMDFFTADNVLIPRKVFLYQEEVLLTLTNKNMEVGLRPLQLSHEQKHKVVVL